MSANNVLDLLATGPESNLDRFHFLVATRLNQIDSRNHTVRYTCMASDLDFAKAEASVSDVTLQRIETIGTRNARRHEFGGGASVVISDNVENYVVLHEGTHAMKWEAKPPGKTRR